MGTGGDAVRREQWPPGRHRRSKALAAAKGLRDFLQTKHAALVERIESTKDLSKDDEAALTAAIGEFKKTAAY